MRGAGAAGRAARARIRTAAPDEHDAVAALVARAFAREEFMAWVTGGGRAAPARLAAFARLAVRMAAAHDGVLVDDERTAAALVLPPGAERQAPLQAVRALPLLLRATGPRRLPVVLAGLARLESAHPAEPHETIIVLGVEPGHQDRGLGGALLRALVARADEAGVATYLETASRRTRAAAARHGYVLHRELLLPGGGPPVWTMLRPPR
jgi:ribosomal protein S18 acetylase RimI-like enzyme